MLQVGGQKDVDFLRERAGEGDLKAAQTIQAIDQNPNTAIIQHYMFLHNARPSPTIHQAGKKAVIIHDAIPITEIKAMAELLNINDYEKRIKFIVYIQALDSIFREWSAK